MADAINASFIRGLLGRLYLYSLTRIAASYYISLALSNICELSVRHWAGTALFIVMAIVSLSAMLVTAYSIGIRFLSKVSQANY